MTEVLETAIGLAFVYLLFSMICSAVQEWFAALFALRAKTLEEGLNKLLCHDPALVQQIYAHPLIQGLSRKTWLDKSTGREARPSYVSSEVFAKALLSVVGVQQPAAGAATIPAGAPAQTRQLLEALWAHAPGDVAALTKGVEGWYNDAMDRVSGWYKRKTHGIILVIALVVAVVANVDTIMLFRAFWYDPGLRAATVQAASDYVRERQLTSPVPAGPSGAKTANAENYGSVTEDVQEPVPPPEQRFVKATESLSRSVEHARSELGRLKVPIGWCEESGPRCAIGQSLPGDWTSWLLKLAGILATMIALSQGAPFWFDLLQKLVNLRLAGDAPDEKKKK